MPGQHALRRPVRVHPPALRHRLRRSGSRGGPPWSHDYPRGEVHFAKILKEITYVQPRLDGSNILSLDDPELFNYPIAYMAEPGFWSMTDKEAESFRAYLKKGGFVIFDDFRERRRALGQPAGADAPRPARGALDRDRRRHAAGLAFVLRDQDPMALAPPPIYDRSD